MHQKKMKKAFKEEKTIEISKNLGLIEKCGKVSNKYTLTSKNLWVKKTKVKNLD